MIELFLENFCIVEYGVCVNNFSYIFQLLFLKLFRHIVDMLKMYIWVMD